MLCAEPVTWTLGDAIAAARDADPGLERAGISVIEARGEATSSWNLLLPDLELGGSLSRSFSEERLDSPWSAGVRASASLGLSPGLNRRMEQRSIAYDAAVVDHMQADVSLVRRVREVFFTVLLSERRLAIAGRNVELAEERLEQLRTLYEQGRASQLELLEARAAAINRKPELLSRRETLLTGQEELKQLTGLTAEDELRLDGEITDIELDLSDQEIRQTLFAESPELQRARLALTSAQVSRSLTSRETRLPRVSAGVSYSPGVTPAFDAEAWTSRETWRTGRFSLGLTVPLDPLVPGSRGDNNVEAAERAEVRAELSVEETEAELRRSAVEFARRLSFSREKLSLLEQSLEIARERYEQTVAAYESGGVELLDVEDAQTALEQAELELLQERYNLIMAVVELDARAGGAILDDGKVLSE